MSTAILETPATAEALPSITDAFSSALKDVKAKEAGITPEPAPTKEAPAAKQPETKAPVKEPVAKEVKTEPVAKKPKSALDAALSDDATASEAAPEVDEVQKLIESKDPNWDKARETMKRQSEELKTFKEKLAKPELPADVTAQLAAAKEHKDLLEKMRAENAKLRDSIIALDVRFDPAVQEKIAGRDNGVAKLAASLKEAGGDAESFVEVMGMPLSKRGKHLDAILEGIESPRTRAIIERKLSEIEVLDEHLDEQMSKPHKSFEELKQQREIQAREHEEQVQKFKDATFEKVHRDLPKLSKLMRPAPADAEGAAEYNEALQADLAKAPTLLEVEPEVAAQAAFMAARYPTLEKMFIERTAKDAARITELEESLARFEGSDVGFRGNGKAKPKSDFERPITDVFNEALRNQRGGEG